jgi:hypothetical protein
MEPSAHFIVIALHRAHATLCQGTASMFAVVYVRHSWQTYGSLSRAELSSDTKDGLPETLGE